MPEDKNKLDTTYTHLVIDPAGGTGNYRIVIGIGKEGIGGSTGEVSAYISVNGKPRPLSIEQIKQAFPKLVLTSLAPVAPGKTKEAITYTQSGVYPIEQTQNSDDLKRMFGKVQELEGLLKTREFAYEALLANQTKSPQSAPVSNSAAQQRISELEQKIISLKDTHKEKMDEINNKVTKYIDHQFAKKEKKIREQTEKEIAEKTINNIVADYEETNIRAKKGQISNFYLDTNAERTLVMNNEKYQEGDLVLLRYQPNGETFYFIGKLHYSNTNRYICLEDVCNLNKNLKNDEDFKSLLKLDRKNFNELKLDSVPSYLSYYADLLNKGTDKDTKGFHLRGENVLIKNINDAIRNATLGITKEDQDKLFIKEGDSKKPDNNELNITHDMLDILGTWPEEEKNIKKLDLSIIDNSVDIEEEKDPQNIEEMLAELDNLLTKSGN